MNMMRGTLTQFYAYAYSSHRRQRRRRHPRRQPITLEGGCISDICLNIVMLIQ